MEGILALCNKLSNIHCRSPPSDSEFLKTQDSEERNMTDQIDWNKILKNEDKLIENSDRKHRYHFKSLHERGTPVLG